MQFTDPCFLFLFLPLTLAIYYLLPSWLKNMGLLAASILFYAAGGSVILILFSIAFNFHAGSLIGKQKDNRNRRAALVFGVVVNLGLLIYFKYAMFLVKNVNAALALGHVRLLGIPQVNLPLGISFFTFHAISYLMDVYRRQAKPLERPFSFALYIVLFPQLIAGPIIRFKTICNQLDVGGAAGRRHTWEQFAGGVRRFIVGLAKKMLIANTVAVAADAAFNPRALPLTPAAAWLGTLCYTLQIYFDFSGYTDMAVGLGAMFGFSFPENFNYPYVATSITDFWRRWHMTLSSWFRDYVYIPMGGNRKGPGRTYLNLIAVFLLCGLWHGATWTFVCWGLFHGTFLLLERAGLGVWLQKHRIIRHAYVLAALSVGWVLFRAESFENAGRYLLAMAFIGDRQSATTAASFSNPLITAAMIAGVIFSMPVIPWLKGAWFRFMEYWGSRRVVPELIARFVELGVLQVLLISSVARSAAGTYNPFIYFRF